jgi:hypothetical protein
MGKRTRLLGLWCPVFTAETTLFFAYAIVWMGGVCDVAFAKHMPANIFNHIREDM